MIGDMVTVTVDRPMGSYHPKSDKKCETICICGKCSNPQVLS